MRVIGADGVDLSTNRFEMKKGGQRTIRVTARAPAAVGKPAPKTDPPAGPPPKDLYPGELVTYETFDDPTASKFFRGTKEGVTYAFENGSFVVTAPAGTARSPSWCGPAIPDAAFVARLRSPHQRAVDFRARQAGARAAWMTVSLRPDGSWQVGHTAYELVAGRRHYLDDTVVKQSSGPDPALAADRWVTVAVRSAGDDYEFWLNGASVARGTVADPPPPAGSAYFPMSGAVNLECKPAAGQPHRLEIGYLAIWKLPAGRFANGLGMEFALVPKGKAWLGGGGGKPGGREVEFKNDFYLGVYPVTQEEWEKVTGTNPAHYSRGGPRQAAVKDISDEDLKRFPVEGVSYKDVEGFLATLNEKAKDAGWVYRLPTADEWEYACRGGPIDKAASAFWFYAGEPSNELPPEKANYAHVGGPNRTVKVGQHSPNRLGLYDMHGDVLEWCSDAGRNAIGEDTRLAHGGSWNDPAGTAASTIPFLPTVRYASLGLRVVRARVK